MEQIAVKPEKERGGTHETDCRDTGKKRFKRIKR